MQTSIPFTMSDVRQKAGLLLAYTSMQAQQFTDAADAVHIILGRRRWRRAQGRRMLLVRPWLKEARRFQHGHFHRLMPELRYEDPSSYFNYLRVSGRPPCLTSSNERLQHAISVVRTPRKRIACIVSAVKAQ